MSESAKISKPVLRLWTALRVLAAAAFLLAPCALPAAAQNLPLDDKARYEKTLEEKVEGVLLKLLGPNQAKVVVQASMDFTRTEKVNLTSEAAANPEKSSLFKWENMSSDSSIPGIPGTKVSMAENATSYLMPGFPSLEPIGSEEKSYQRQMLYPASFIKRLTVSVILDKNRSNAEAQSVRTVVSEVLGLDLARGDELSIIRTPFAPFWKTLWYTPDAVSVIFKYVILTIMGIVAMIVVSIGFLRLAGAMNTMAQAQQGQQITMDLGREALAAAAGPGAAEKPSPSPAMPKEAEVAAAGRRELMFDVRPDQVDSLAALMAGEDPGNVALVANHLKPSVRSAFLDRLPAGMSADVVSHMAGVRFVEADIIATIKEELERKLSGAVGGVSTVVEALDKAGLKARKSMLEQLEKKHPEIARQVRLKVLLPEDLERLSDKDLAALAAAVKPEDLASAFWGLPAAFKEKIKAQLPEKSWQTVSQAARFGAPSDEKVDSAVEHLVDSARALIREGRIADPLDRPAELLENKGA